MKNFFVILFVFWGLAAFAQRPIINLDSIKVGDQIDLFRVDKIEKGDGILLTMQDTIVYVSGMFDSLFRVNYAYAWNDFSFRGQIINPSGYAFVSNPEFFCIYLDSKYFTVKSGKIYSNIPKDKEFFFAFQSKYVQSEFYNQKQNNFIRVDNVLKLEDVDFPEPNKQSLQLLLPLLEEAINQRIRKIINDNGISLVTYPKDIHAFEFYQKYTDFKIYINFLCSLGYDILFEGVSYKLKKIEH